MFLMLQGYLCQNRLHTLYYAIKGADWDFEPEE